MNCSVFHQEITVNIIKNLISDLLPPILRRHIQKCINPSSLKTKVSWHGDYQTWENAQSASEGYDSNSILEKVKSSTLKVKNGDAIYERDSFIFDEIQYSWPILSGLLWTAAVHDGKLNVLDFGGSLGSSYFQNINFLSRLSEVHWGVVEQENFVACGREFIQDDILRFYSSIEEYFTQNTPNVALFSSVLSYVPDWLHILQVVLSKKIHTVLIDRTPFVLQGKERITIQTVPESIYRATYPCRFLEEQQLKLTFKSCGYHMIEEFIALDKANLPSVHKGFIFTYKSSN